MILDSQVFLPSDAVAVGLDGAVAGGGGDLPAIPLPSLWAPPLLWCTPPHPGLSKLPLPMVPPEAGPDQFGSSPLLLFHYPTHQSATRGLQTATRGTALLTLPTVVMRLARAHPGAPAHGSAADPCPPCHAPDRLDPVCCAQQTLLGPGWGTASVPLRAFLVDHAALQYFSVLGPLLDQLLPCSTPHVRRTRLFDLVCFAPLIDPLPVPIFVRDAACTVLFDQYPKGPVPFSCSAVAAGH